MTDEYTTETYRGTLMGRAIQTELIISRDGHSMVRYYDNGPQGSFRAIGGPVFQASESDIEQLRTLARGYVL